MQQIRERRYDERLRNEGRNDILAYGIAFCKKKCKVVVERAIENKKKALSITQSFLLLQNLILLLHSFLHVHFARKYHLPELRLKGHVL